MNPNDNIEEREALENIAPTLFSIKKKQEFKVPANYFEQLPGQIQNQITQPQSVSIVEKIWSLINYKVLVPVATILLLGFFSIHYFNTENPQLAELTSEEIEHFISEENYEVDEDLLIQNLVEDDEYFEEENISSEAPISDTEIINYLIDNDIDISSIINEM